MSCCKLNSSLQDWYVPCDSVKEQLVWNLHYESNHGIFLGKIFSARHVIGGIMKPLRKTYLEISKEIETIHIHSASMYTHCHKVYDSNSIQKKIIRKWNLFRCICIIEDRIPKKESSSVYAPQICYFRMNFYKKMLNLNFCGNVPIYTLWMCIV